MSPHIFKKWGAVATIAGALEQKVWCYLHKYRANLYPNMYTIIVAPPGVGKGVLIHPVRSLWRALPEHYMASSSLTRASLVDELKDAERRIVRPSEDPPILSFNSLLMCVSELAVLIPAYETDFMNKLTDIYDCVPYGERRRGKDLEIKIEKPQFNLFAATTPGYLHDVLPDGAWDQGFLSRVMLIYNGQVDTSDIFADDFTGGDAEQLKRFQDLAHDLKIIGNLIGEFKFTDEFRDAVRAWRAAGMEPIPDHPKLLHYKSRRTAHLLKLCMAISVSQGNNLVIDVHHYQEALNMLLEAEAVMPDIFKAMRGVSGSIGAMQELHHVLRTMYLKDKSRKPIPESYLVEFLMERVEAYNIDSMILAMERAGVIKPQLGDIPGKKYYIPRTKEVPT